MSDNGMTQDQVIRAEAVRLAILQKEKNGSRYTIHSVAVCFSDYIKDGKEFRID